MSAPSVKAGDILANGKYRVERVLGTGGMGMVVAARHVELGQRVALKFMLEDAMDDPSNQERFAREAKAAVQLQSPHTARVLDVGKLKNGEPYMVMEYLDGSDLDAVLQRTGPMQPEMAIGYMLQACEAFAEAHGLGVIHRDIKLKNLFLAKSVDGRALVKVLDFGLAKTTAVGDVSLTSTTAVFGSPQYMSPEQMRSAKDVDARSDIWSIGVCLYELLTGRVPFDAPGVAEICAMVLKDPVEPPSRYAPGLPAALDAVIVKCLAKDPADRYQTVAELGFALEPWTIVEGSARRILHVMQSAEKTDLPTLPNVGNEDVPPNNDEIAKTMDAWDSGERARATKNRRSAVAIVVAFAMAATGTLFLAATGLQVLRHRSAAQAISSQPIESAPPAADAPPEAVAEPVSTPPEVPPLHESKPAPTSKPFPGAGAKPPRPAPPPTFPRPPASVKPTPLPVPAAKPTPPAPTPGIKDRF